MISSNLEPARVGWIDHVMMRSEEDLVRAYQELRVDGGRGKGEYKLTWEQVVRTDIAACERDRSLVADNGIWKGVAIRSLDPAIDGIMICVEVSRLEGRSNLGSAPLRRKWIISLRSLVLSWGLTMGETKTWLCAGLID